MMARVRAMLKAIFQPRDGTRQRVKDEVISSSQKVDRAVTRFEETISELLDKNDRLTGRPQRKQDNGHD